MKQKLKNGIGILVIVCLIASMASATGPLLRPLNCDICVNAIKAFEVMPEDAFEVIGYGSSHMWRTLNPIEMYEKHGVGAYNYGCNWQHLNTTLLFMQESFRTQSPKVVLVECFRVNELLVDKDLNGEIYYTSALQESAERREYLKQCFGNDAERYLSYYIPFYGFHGEWSNIGRDNFKESSNSRDFTKSLGFVPTEGAVTIKLGDASAFPQMPLSGEAIEILDKMVALCKENGAELVFFTTPYQGEWGYSDAMKAYAQENDCVFLNFFELAEEVGIDTSTDFQDPGHTNTIGGNKISNYLAKYIVENYEVTDMRKVPNNLWEQ